MVSTKEIIIGAGAALAGLILLTRSGNEQSGLLSDQELGQSDGTSVPTSVPNPFETDYAGILDESVGNLDETVGGAIQGTADNLGSGPGELVDDLASESVAQEAIRSLSPELAAAETAEQAGSGVVEGILGDGEDSEPAPGPTSTGTETVTQETVTEAFEEEQALSSSGPTPEPYTAPEPDSSGSYNEYDDPDTSSIETELPGLTLDPDDV